MNSLLLTTKRNKKLDAVLLAAHPPLKGGQCRRGTERKENEHRDIDLNKYRAKRILDGWSKRFGELEKQLHSSSTVYSHRQSNHEEMQKDSKKIESKEQYLMLFKLSHITVI
jgi:hypothetical protein